METPASIARHPIHPILVSIPIGLWVFSLVCDLVVLLSDTDEVEILAFNLGYYTMAGGLAGALLAAIPGFMDYLSFTDQRLRKLAATHLTINVVVVAIYGLNLWFRSAEPPSFMVGIGLSFVGLGLLGISGWIGGEMVHVHGVGVARESATLDLVSSEDARSAPTTPAPTTTQLGSP